MANSERLDELKKKFDENPRRYFAPLANEHRKAGDADQAIAICREFLPQQPGHMSGHIVYGQALFDAQQYEEARTVFDTALTLDPENLIALRHLGDIARTQGDVETARSWYLRVLEADPRNNEIAELLKTLAAMPAAPEAPAAEAAASPEAPAAETAPPSKAPEATVVISAVKLDEPGQPVAEEQAPESEPASEPEPEPVVSEAPPAPEPVMSVAPEPPAEDELLDLDEFSLDHEEPMVPRVSSSRMSMDAMDLDLERSDNDTFEVADEVAAGPEAAAEEPELIAEERDVAFEEFEVAPAEPEVVDEAPPASPVDPLNTETMAELYLSQGHREDALLVYRHLLEARPGDSALRARVAELEATPAVSAAPVAPPQAVPSSSGPSIREFLAGLASRTPASPAPSASPASPASPVAAPAEAWEEAPDSAPAVELRDGGSIDALFGGAGVSHEDQEAATSLAGAFGMAATLESSGRSSGIAGAPARRATNELSLDSVFSKSGSQDKAPAKNFTFDKFFAGGTPARGSSAMPAPTPAASGAQDPAASDADIEQFNSWLDGLKKK